VRLFYTKKDREESDRLFLESHGLAISPYYEIAEDINIAYGDLPEKLKDILLTRRGWNIGINELKNINIVHRREKEIYEKSIISKTI